MEYLIICLLLINLLLIIYVIFKLSKRENAFLNKENDNANLINFDEKMKYQLERLEFLNNSLFDKIKIRLDSYDKGMINLSDSFSQTHKLIYEQLHQINKDNYEFNQQVKNKLIDDINVLNRNINDTLNNLRKSINDQINEIRVDNNNKLDKINEAVNEKLEKTLEGKLKQSFDSVIEQISGVNKAIGEIKGLANDVGSLKNVLTNVKTKGIVGEVILGNIIKEMLTVGQYEENIVTKHNSNERVEFAIKLPSNDNEYIYLPIDSKFPLESYHKIKDGMDNGNVELIKEGRNSLKQAIKKYAKSISDKYIDVPNTTDFAIMFLPIEGLYIEVLNLGLFEEVQREYRINIAGPTTLTAILNSLQMGFKTLVIQKKSADVFKLLGAVKTEFEKFASVLEKTQKKFGEASDELDKLVGTRTRMIQMKLKNIENLDISESKDLLGIEE